MTEIEWIWRQLLGEHDWVASVLRAVFMFLLAVVLAAWWSQSRHRRGPGDSMVLRHTHVLLVAGSAIIAVCAGAALMTAVQSKEPVEPWLYVIFLALGGVGAYAILEFSVVRYELDGQGMNYTTTFGGSGGLAWSDLRRLEYSNTMKRFRLETHTGNAVRVSALLTGLPEFAWLCLERTNAGVIDDKALAILEETAEGNLPPLW